ncbi:hypothetical protein ABZ202_29470 [Streptomyces sp. NPDC006186]|uniref:hypothetical protein n=1 Tax=Streptomyces sp. NPDC006186 TaxID=3155248 RepID=UPI0033B7BD5F
MHQQPQLPLDIPEDGRGLLRERPSLDERFEAFHSSHPWIFEALEELTAEWVAAGGGQIGIKALFEQLRWSTPRIAGGEPFRLNNNYTSRYARLLCARHPEWAGVFQLRNLRTSSTD